MVLGISKRRESDTILYGPRKTSQVYYINIFIVAISDSYFRFKVINVRYNNVEPGTSPDASKAMTIEVSFKNFAKTN